MNTCPACGANVDDSGVCSACGLRLEDATASFAPVGEDLGAEERTSVPTEGPVLVVRKGPELGERFYIDRQRLTIGRDPGADVFLNDVTVSRRHAVLTTAGSEVTVEDAGSLNGIYINGVCVDKAVLTHGDAVQIGTFQMVYLSGRDA